MRRIIGTDVDCIAYKQIANIGDRFGQNVGPKTDHPASSDRERSRSYRPRVVQVARFAMWQNEQTRKKCAEYHSGT